MHWANFGRDAEVTKDSPQEIRSYTVQMRGGRKANEGY
jgi:hypothetical protein